MIVWKDIQGYDGFYQVNNVGQIKRLMRTGKYTNHGKIRIQHWPEIIMKLSLSGSGMGYPFVTLHKNNTVKIFSVHRLVALAFIPNPDNKPQVNHINGVKTDNRVENLEWCTASENLQHSVRTGLYGSREGVKNPNTKLTESDIIMIREFGKANSSRVVGEKFSIPTTTAYYIISKRTWKNV